MSAAISPLFWGQSIKRQMRKFVIRSTYREKKDSNNCYFCAIHSFTPFFSILPNARKFASKAEATAYAIKELFDCKEAFDIVEI